MVRIKWLLVEWENRSGILPQYGLVNINALVNRSMELHTGKLVFVANAIGPTKRAKIVMASDDRRFLEQQLLAMQEHSQQIEAAAAACRDALIQQVSPSPANQHGSQSGPESLNLQHDHNKKSPSWSADTNSDSESEIQTVHQRLAAKQDRNGQIRKPISKVNPSKSKSHYNNLEMPQRHSFINKQKYINHCQTPPQVCSTPISRSVPERNDSVMTYDQGTQTGIRFNAMNIDIVPKVEEKVALLESVIDEMEEKISILEATIDSWTVFDFDESREANENMMDISARQNSVNILNEQHKQEISIAPTPDAEQRRLSFPDVSDSDGVNEMVPIGTGRTFVPKHIISQIDWNSYTIATRKLLMALFPRRTLATHSLTGKSSPAFMDRPAKLCLDPVKVNDIVIAVTTNCNVKEGLVRSAITTKCADENKMYRMRQEKRKKTSNGNDQENIPPHLYKEDQNDCQ